ncbi:hypothetical protein LTR95_001831 [Oleoguttula sp. CCFEE 5521]
MSRLPILGDLGAALPVSEASQPSAPLVIVSEQGRHDQASRRLVRAQAARASAAQSRITRARNREEREARDASGASNASASPGTDRSSASQSRSPPIHSPHSPLSQWLHATSGIPNQIDVLQQAGGQVLQALPGRVLGLGDDSLPGSLLGGDRTLPLAVPRGFTDLAQRLELSADFLMLVSRTACFDFVSTGVDVRLGRLVSDQVQLISDVAATTVPRHNNLVERNMTLACTCVAMYQTETPGQNSAGANARYSDGLFAAWSEARIIDQRSLRDPNALRASLWCVVVICVTTRGTAEPSIFYGVVGDLLRDLNISSWEQLRAMLLDFIYPGTTLDEPTRRFYDEIRRAIAGRP